MRDLQAFLIKRFIYILVLVTVAQSLISFLISHMVMPVVMKVFSRITRGSHPLERRICLFLSYVFCYC